MSLILLHLTNGNTLAIRASAVDYVCKVKDTNESRVSYTERGIAQTSNIVTVINDFKELLTTINRELSHE